MKWIMMKIPKEGTIVLISTPDFNSGIIKFDYNAKLPSIVQHYLQHYDFGVLLKKRIPFDH